MAKLVRNSTHATVTVDNLTRPGCSIHDANRFHVARSRHCASSTRKVTRFHGHLTTVGASDATRLCRAICVKNAVDFLISTITWLAFGYALALGDRGDLGDFAGTTRFFAVDLPTGDTEWCAQPPCLHASAHVRNLLCQVNVVFPVDLHQCYVYYRVRHARIAHHVIRLIVVPEFGLADVWLHIDFLTTLLNMPPQWSRCSQILPECQVPVPSGVVSRGIFFPPSCSRHSSIPWWCTGAGPRMHGSRMAPTATSHSPISLGKYGRLGEMPRVTCHA